MAVLYGVPLEPTFTACFLTCNSAIQVWCRILEDVVGKRSPSRTAYLHWELYKLGALNFQRRVNGIEGWVENDGGRVIQYCINL